MKDRDGAILSANQQVDDAREQLQAAVEKMSALEDKLRAAKEEGGELDASDEKEILLQKRVDELKEELVLARTQVSVGPSCPLTMPT